MLKGIPKVIPPKLMKMMMEMGHGDELIIADGNYPAFSQGVEVIEADGHEVKVLLDAILEFFPLDTYTEKPVALMEVVKGDPTVPVVWEDYKKILQGHGYSEDKISHIDRFDFYDRSKKAYGIVSTSDQALYANILIKKGVC